MSDGYIGLYRSLFNKGGLWSEKRVFSRAEAWLDLLQLAAFAPTERFINGKFIHHQIGEFVAAERFLVKRWGWSRTKVRNFIQNHEKAHKLDQRKDQGEVVRIICNYGTYVFLKTKEDTKEKSEDETINQTDEEPPKNQGRTKTNKEKEEKKEKKSICKKAKADSIEEVIDYCKSLGLETSDGVYFWNHWEGNGWINGGKVIKDWKATIRAWKAYGHLSSQKNGGTGKGSSYGKEGAF